LSNQEETLPTATPTTQVDSKPVVTITSPTNGSEARVNTQVLITATVRDDVGVTRVQMTANGVPVKTVSSDQANGDKDKNWLLDFTPLVTGDVQVQIIAYRNTVASDPASLTVKVVSVQATTTSLPNPGVTQGPVINPNDPTCRAVPTTGLNFRSGPGTNYGVLTQLGTNSVLPVVGRLGDNSWYQLNNFGSLGWVAGGFVNLYGSLCGSVPVIQAPATATVPASATPQPSATPTITPPPSPTPGTPNLVITQFDDMDEDNDDIVLIIPAGQTEVTGEFSITIANVGSRRSDQFTLRLKAGQGSAEETIVIGNMPRDQAAAYVMEYTFIAPGDYILEAFVDSTNSVNEISEADNKSQLVVKVIQGS
jgi:uncharacterized protein YraI